jgi:uncharacterized membrane protein YgcG
MTTRPAVALLALAGLLLAVSIGLGAYFASRDSVGLPVTKLDPAPRDLAPTVARKRTSTGPATTRATTTVEERHGGSTQTTEDHSGSGGGGGSNSGHGGGGGDD